MFLRPYQTKSRYYNAINQLPILIIFLTCLFRTCLCVYFEDFGILTIPKSSLKDSGNLTSFSDQNTTVILLLRETPDPLGYFLQQTIYQSGGQLILANNNFSHLHSFSDLSFFVQATKGKSCVIFLWQLLLRP